MVKVVRLPEERYGRLFEMAKRRGISVHQLMGELTQNTSTESKRQYRVSAIRGSVRRGMDRAFDQGEK